jgi:hypothetical protein
VEAMLTTSHYLLLCSLPFTPKWLCPLPLINLIKNYLSLCALLSVKFLKLFISDSFLPVGSIRIFSKLNSIAFQLFPENKKSLELFVNVPSTKKCLSQRLPLGQCPRFLTDGSSFQGSCSEFLVFGKSPAME